MLSTFESSVAAVLLLGDLLVIGAYVGASSTRGAKRYPSRSFVVHVVGSLSALLLGALALLAYSIGWAAFGTVVAVGQGVAVVAFAGCCAFVMARYTSGFSGFNLVGYVLYTVAWIGSGVMVIGAPGVQTAYACFVLTHAYLTCRVMVWAIETGWERLTGRPAQPEVAYSVATTIAALIPLWLAWGTLGVAWHLSSVAIAIALHRAGISPGWHAGHVSRRSAGRAAQGQR